METKKIFFVLFMVATAGLYGQIRENHSPLFTQVFTIPGSSSGWSTIDNAEVSDDVYIYNSSNLPLAGNYSDILRFTEFGFAIPDIATILGIEVLVERRDLNSKAKDQIVNLIKNGVIVGTNMALTSAWSATDNQMVYGNDSLLWGETWTPADVNHPDFGLAFSITRSGGGPQIIDSGIDQVIIAVYYTDQILPVVLDEFSGYQQDDAVRLYWSTHNESMMDHFAIKRQFGGGSVMLAGNIDATGDSLSYNEYEYFDRPSQEGKYNYSIFEVGLNGNETLLGNVEVSFTPPESISMDVLYDQVSEEIPKILIRITEGSDAFLKVTNSTGGIMMDLKFQLKPGENEIVLSNFENAESGIYFVLLEVENKSIVKKFLHRK